MKTAALILMAWCTLAQAATVTATVAAPARYALKQIKAGDGKTNASIINVQTGRTLWWHRLGLVESTTWSPDHTTLAILEDRPDSLPGHGRYRLFLWHAGYPVHVVTRLKPKKQLARAAFLNDDIMMSKVIQQIAISPDNRRLLIRSSSDKPAINEGGLWCLNAADFRLQLISPNVYEDANWIANNQVKYKAALDNAHALNQTRIANVL